MELTRRGFLAAVAGVIAGAAVARPMWRQIHAGIDPAAGLDRSVWFVQWGEHEVAGIFPKGSSAGLPEHEQRRIVAEQLAEQWEAEWMASRRSFSSADVDALSSITRDMARGNPLRR
jgi:hypothetical protein